MRGEGIELGQRGGEVGLEWLRQVVPKLCTVDNSDGQSILECGGGGGGGCGVIPCHITFTQPHCADSSKPYMVMIDR